VGPGEFEYRIPSAIAALLVVKCARYTTAQHLLSAVVLYMFACTGWAQLTTWPLRSLSAPSSTALMTTRTTHALGKQPVCVLSLSRQ
jgi:hypothetical protein